MKTLAGMGLPDQIVPLQLVMGLARHNPSNLFLPVVGDNKVEPKLLLRAVIYWVRIVVITFFRHAVR